MNCCDALGWCTRGDDCCARAAEAKPTQPPLDWIPAPKDMHEPLSLIEKAFIVIVVLAGCSAGGGLIYAGLYYSLPGVF